MISTHVLNRGGRRLEFHLRRSAAWVFGCRMTVSWKFKYRRFHHETKLRMESAVRDAGTVCGKKLSLLKSGLGRILSSVDDKYIFAVYIDSTRPPRKGIVAYNSSTGLSYTPSVNQDDINFLIHELNLQSDYEVVVLHGVCHCNYGLIHKNILPYYIASPEDCKTVGLNGFSDEIKSFLEKRMLVIWERWGGKLEAYEVDLDNKSSLLERHTIATGVGNYKQLPFYVQR